MEIHELQQLLSEMSLQEKIGQMVQLTGAYFDKEAVLTGVVGEQLPPEWIIQYAGSVLGVIGKDKIYDIQSRYMEQHPHHIPLIGLRSIALKAVMTIAGFAFSAIRKGFTYCSRNVRWDISTSLYSLPAFTAP